MNTIQQKRVRDCQKSTPLFIRSSYNSIILRARRKRSLTVKKVVENTLEQRNENQKERRHIHNGREKEKYRDNELEQAYSRPERKEQEESHIRIPREYSRKVKGREEKKAQEFYYQPKKGFLFKKNS